MLAAANCITIDGFLQHGRKLIKKNLRCRGGFQPGSSLTHMNRHKQQTAGENQTLERKNQCKLKNQ